MNVLERWKDVDTGWNRCDVCGRFIAYGSFIGEGRARRWMITPDSEFSHERWGTLCQKHAKEEDEDNGVDN